MDCAVFSMDKAVTTAIHPTPPLAVTTASLRSLRNQKHRNVFMLLWFPAAVTTAFCLTCDSRFPEHGGDHRFPQHGGDNRFNNSRSNDDNNNNSNSVFSSVAVLVCVGAELVRR
jgi:hypothetical protein